MAVKLLRSGRDDRADVDRLLAEGKAGAQLAHPNIAAVYDIGDTGPASAAPYIVMELCADRTVTTTLGRGPLGWRQTARIGAEVGADLTHAHTLSIVHSRLTADEVVLTDVGAKVLGFTMLQTLHVPSTDGAAGDVHALGLPLHECIATTDPPPPALGALLERCLHPRPVMRPSAHEAAGVLAEFAAVQVELPTYPSSAVLRRGTHHVLPETSTPIHSRPTVQGGKLHPDHPGVVGWRRPRRLPGS